jgi:hypothetical protein
VKGEGRTSVAHALSAALALVALTLCAGSAAAAEGVARIRALDPATAERILALDPDRLSEDDVRATLARAPAPRILLFQGSVAFVTMTPFGEFLAGMGYPDERMRDPRSGSYSRSSFADSARVAGEVAWHYEHDGMVPMLIGHSQGGMLVIRVLYELAGEFHRELPVVDPVADAVLSRTSIRDPWTGVERPVIGLKVGYATALATGKTMRVLLGQWSMLSRLRTIPDTVDEFTGFMIPGDPLAGGLWDDEPYRAAGSARVRNVTLPASYTHIGLPLTRHLAIDPMTRQWIAAYVPGATSPPVATDADVSNVVHAADIWYSVKKHWCIEAQRAIRAARAAS